MERPSLFGRPDDPGVVELTKASGDTLGREEACGGSALQASADWITG
jgi:hypothetical protein